MRRRIPERSGLARRARRRAASLVALVALAAVASPACTIDFDAHFDGGGGGASATSSSSQGGGGGGGDPVRCESGGCFDGAECVAGVAFDACGSDGRACEDCDDDNPCTEDACGDAGCTHAPIDGVCPGGVCNAGACEPLSEDCTNGVDDDDDALVDCEDDTCTGAGYSCAPAIPSGWAGPVVLHEGMRSVGCVGAYTEVAHAGGRNPTAGAASCSACTCGAAECAAPNLLVFSQPDDLGQPCASGCAVNVGFPAGVTCVAGSGVGTACPIVNGQTAEVFLGYVDDSAGSCTPSAVNVTNLPPPTWGRTSIVCASPSVEGTAGCGGASLCVPPPSGQFDGRICVARVGEKLACPPDYPEHPYDTAASSDVYTSIDDTRACAACGCGAPSCDGTVSVHVSQDCSATAVETVSVPYGQCTGVLSNDLFGLSFKYTPAAGAACAPSGGAPTGGVAQSGAVTVCCTPSLL